MTNSNEGDVLRDVLGEPKPAGARRDEARARLDALIASEPALGSLGRSRDIRLVGAAVAVVILATMALLAWPKAPASALQELAAVARQVNPTEIPPGAFAYTRSEHLVLAGATGDQLPGIDDGSVAYLLPTTRQAWIRADGFVQLAITTHRPIFFDPSVEAAYYRAGRDRFDAVGETVTAAFGEVTDPFAGIVWPTDPEELEGTLDALVPVEAGQPPREVQLLQLTAAILRERIIEPDTRAALLEVLATLDLEVTVHDGVVTVAFDYEQRGLLRYTVSFDEAGYLRAESTTLLEATDAPYIPADTVISLATYTPPVVVPDLQTAG